VSFDPIQAREIIVRPVLQYLDAAIPYSTAAENLLLGTMAQESRMGMYVKQLGGGPALGIYQCEPATHADLWQNFIMQRPALNNMLLMLSLSRTMIIPNVEDLIYSLKYATAICRVHYWRVREGLPRHDDVVGMGGYWKAYYNSYLGKGTVTEFVTSYARYVR
jgi:hypothetical protein